ncbi:hypothetical protein N7463_008607 [Penicillium fimorum]|uniref:Uncharacterized protein n=1 Tax=Penicillium fimorum TaxID=1882269 RepID=A0A9W9XQ08_9EURO|nr:hypothetical protein N7463_008607 [Penicillium fimorum]
MEAIMPKRLTHSPSNMVLPNGSSSSMRGTTTPSSSLSCATLVDAPLEQSSVEGKLASGDTDANITQRFVIVLEAMQKAGFQDFDVMAVAYYTTQFEKGSLPAMVQCASRSRRLKAMVQELHESTGQWPRWESRGLRESVSEATGESGAPLIITLNNESLSCFKHPSAWKKWSD